MSINIIIIYIILFDFHNNFYYTNNILKFYIKEIAYEQ